MTSTTSNDWNGPGQHPLLACVDTVAVAVLGVADVDPSYLSASEKRIALVELTRVTSQLEELRLRVLSAAQSLGDVADEDGARDAAAWLRVNARLDSGHARHLARIAAALERYSVVAGALCVGAVDVAQAEVIAAALDALPDHVPADIRQMAEERLVFEAEEFGPRQLRQLGKRILDVVAPDVAEAEEARQLADEDNKAKATTFLRFRRRGDGTTDIYGRLSDAVAMRLQRYLQAWTNPRRSRQESDGEGVGSEARTARTSTGGESSGGGSGGGEKRPYDQRMGEAFGAFLEAADPTRMPLHGGDATTVVVTIDLDTLRAQLTTAGVALIGDEPITAAQARRLACTAGIVPAVLGGESQVLDLGRTRRLYQPPQRKALAIRYPTCAAHGCDIPAPWCEAHHAGDPWSQGGRTDLDDGVLLCSHHHHIAHDPRYDTTRHPDGSIRFHKRT